MSTIPPEINSILEDLSLVHAAYFERYGKGQPDLSAVRIQHNEKFGDWMIIINQHSDAAQWAQEQDRSRNIRCSFENHTWGSMSHTAYDYRLSFRPEDADAVHKAAIKAIEAAPSLPDKPALVPEIMPG